MLNAVSLSARKEGLIDMSTVIIDANQELLEPEEGRSG